jgi:hypothetical protein
MNKRLYQAEVSQVIIDSLCTTTFPLTVRTFSETNPTKTLTKTNMTNTKLTVTLPLMRAWQLNNLAEFRLRHAFEEAERDYSYGHDEGEQRTVTEE